MARHNVPGVVYHSISRFVDRTWFFNDDVERSFYLFLLGRALAESDWRCLCYALMSNHIHLGLVAGAEPMQAWTRRVNSPFAEWMNRRHGRLGPIFAHRPKDFAVLPDNEGSLIAYIHNNPVRARVVDHARLSTWTSHRAYLGAAARPAWLAVHEGLSRAGFDDVSEFDAWVDRTPGQGYDVNLERARLALRRRGSIEVGTPTNADGRTMFPLFARPFGHVRPDPRRIVELVAEITQVEQLVICSRLRQAHRARALAVHCGRAVGITRSDLAAVLGISAQAVGALARKPLLEEERAAVRWIHERISTETWGAVVS